MKCLDGTVDAEDGFAEWSRARWVASIKDGERTDEAGGSYRHNVASQCNNVISRGNLHVSLV